jgi:hypothetical protein
MELIREVGAVAGLAAFLGLAVLALLYFSQARDVRRLRENAEFLVEGEGVPTAAEGEPAEPVPAAVASEEPAEAARAAAATAPNEAEAFRRAELARQAAERRQRFEQRRGGEGGGPRAWFGDLPSTAVIVVGALILIAGIGFGATSLLGGDDDDGGGGADGEKLACPAISTKVAVLNGTAEAGLAASYARRLQQAGYERGPVTNTESAFDGSVVMFDQASQRCAPEVASTAGLTNAPAEPMSQEITGIAEGSQVAVVLGEDVASGGTSESEPATEGSTDTIGG